ncbi:hydrogenase maturation protease [Nocardia higoensis]|uniref:hydrogenase maturation protease n=1 Tax=Nocardia higoensis TaxID=228599 RepID=UPI00031D863D|nr:hydrogenase maturation protease [Nocardia higoensis]
MTGARAAVIGVGNDYRGDDGVGPSVARELARLDLPGVAVTVCDGEPTGLLDAWTGVELAVVVDAVRCEPATPGRIRRTGVDSLPGGTYPTSSHALGIPDALLLGRALGRVPRELVVIAVEAASFHLGAGLSAPVAAAVPRVVRTVLAELRRLGQPARTPMEPGLDQ